MVANTFLNQLRNAVYTHYRKQRRRQASQALDVLMYLATWLSRQGWGQVVNAPFRLAQRFIAKRLGLSAKWVGELVRRLQQEGWLIYHSTKLPDGTNSRTQWRIGPKFKQMLFAIGLWQRKSVAKPVWNYCSSVPIPKRKEHSFSIHSSTDDPTPAQLAGLPPDLQRFAAIK